MISQCGLTMQPWKGRELPEAGYLLQRAYWRRGYAVETAGACFRNAECQRGLFHHQRHQHRVAEGGPSQRHDPNGCLDKTLPRRGYAASPLYGLSYLAAMQTGKRRDRLGCGVFLSYAPSGLKTIFCIQAETFENARRNPLCCCGIPPPPSRS